MDAEKLLSLELRGCFDFFWNEANCDPQSPGYGLIPDRSDNKNISSIAAVGFGLAAYVIGVKRGFITYERGLERVRGTLITLKNNVAHNSGFFIHFCSMKSAQRYKNSEFSTIDTAIALNGVITAWQFFENDEIAELANEIVSRVNWNELIYEENEKLLFRMAYRDGNQGKIGYFGGWTMCAEQLMMYILAAGHDSIESETAKKLYLGFDRSYKEYGGHGCYYETGGTLFTYQYSHAWFDFSKYLGCDGIDWAKNTRNATLAQISWCGDHPEIKTFERGLWGVSASDSINGYSVQGTEPCARPPKVDGTIAPCVICGSLPFTYEESVKALCSLYINYPDIWGQYGFKDACNIGIGWYSTAYLGIDKGETILMIANALYGDVWNSFMQHPIIKKAVNKLEMKSY